MDAGIAEILAGMSRAQVSLYQLGDGLTSLRRAFDYYLQVGNAALAAALVEVPYTADFMRRIPDIIEKVVGLVPPDSLEAARALSNFGFVVGQRSDGYPQAHEAFETALAIARREGDYALEARITGLAANIDGFHMRIDECLEKSRRAIEIARNLDDPITNLRGHLWALNSAIAKGRTNEAEVYAADLLELAERFRNIGWLFRSLLANIALAYLKGEWATALNLCERAESLLPNNRLLSLAEGQPPFWLRNMRALLDFQLGDEFAGDGRHPATAEIPGLRLREE